MAYSGGRFWLTPPAQLPLSGYSDPLSRLALIRRLSNLPAPQLEQIIFALNPPKGNIPAAAAPTLRVNALLEWVENPDLGCGWAMLEQVVAELLPREAEVETPQGWLLAHPYGMPPHFTGRKAELQMLSDWLGNDQPLLVLRALGGFGKSALTWHWLTQQVSQGDWPLVVWWSFYEASASFENFLSTTLRYLSPSTPLRASGLRVETLSPRQQLAALLQILQQRRVLLVMDGFERELRAYSGMGAAYQGDEETNLPSPSGRGARGEGRDCISPYAEEFLRQMASLPNLKGKVQMSTRLRPRPVELHGGVLLQGCREQELTQLQPEDAVAFFRAQGIQGNRAEIQQACEAYGCHPLSLRLLAGYVLQDFQYPGDIRAAASLDLTGGLIQRRNHVLARSYENLSVQGKALLGRIACFRSPVTYAVLDAIEQARDPATDLDHGSAMALPDALRDLLNRGLLHQDLCITRQGRLMRFDLHPIVRRYAYERMGTSDRTMAHGQLRDYFAAVPEAEKVTTLEDLAPVIELYHHMVRAGQYDEACDLFYERINKATYYQLGAYQLRIELLRSLFPQGEDQPPRLKDEGDQGWTLNALANSYSLNGQPAQAVPLFERRITICEKLDDKQNWAIALSNLAYMAQLPIGALAAAETNLRRSIALGQELEDGFGEAVAHQELGRLLTYRGVWAEAEAELEQSSTYNKDTNDLQGLCIDWADRALLALHQHRSGATAAPALIAATRALELADEWQKEVGRPNARDYVRAHWLLGAAHRVNGDLSQSDTHLSDALSRCRAINMVDHEADILLDLARLRVDQRQPDAALRLAEAALRITERSGYVLQGADVRLFLAQQALARGDTTEARAQAQAAQDLAHCDGGDHTYSVAYAEADDLLQQLTP